MKPRGISRIAVMLCMAVAAVSAADAGSTDYLFSVSHVSSDDQYFLNLTVSNFGFSRAVVEPVLPRLAVVEADLPVVLFLARESGEAPGHIVDLRARGMSWEVVFGQVGVPVDVLFVGIDRDPGPPFGRSWGHWRKRGHKARFADGEITGLVRLQLGSRWAGLTTFELASSCGRGKRISTLVADHRGRPHRHGEERSGRSGHGHGGDHRRRSDGRGESEHGDDED